jgi:hypothetical protein
MSLGDEERLQGIAGLEHGIAALPEDVGGQAAHARRTGNFWAVVHEPVGTLRRRDASLALRQR